MNEPGNPFVLIGVAALVLIGAVIWSTIAFTHERNAFDDKCHASGGQTIHPRGEVLCVSDGRIIGWMRA